MFVAGKHSIRQAVVFVELRDHVHHGSPIGLSTGNERPHRPGLNGLPVVYAVGCQCEILEPAAFRELDSLRRYPFFVGEVRVLGYPVVALGMQQRQQIQQFRVTGAVVEPDDAQRLVLPAKLSPVA
jgi:hypothetical protein